MTLLYCVPMHYDTFILRANNALRLQLPFIGIFCLNTKGTIMP